MGTVGYTGRGRGGHTGCEATEWVSETSVRCKVGQGVQGSRRAVVTAGERSGSVTEAWSTDVAGLSEVQGMNTVGSGGVSVTVQGTRMGTVAYTGRARGGEVL